MDTAQHDPAADPNQHGKDVPTAAGRWVPTKERLPTKEELDPADCVLAWHEQNGCMVVNHTLLLTNRYYTHWQVLPDRPKDGGEYGKPGTAPHDDAADNAKESKADQ